MISLFFTQILPFIRNYWRVILIGLIVGACLAKLNALINERNDYKNKYITMQAAFEAAADIRAKEIAALKANAQKRVENITKQHEADLNNILKGKANEKRTINALNVERDSLRKQLANQASVRLPENDTNKFTTSDSNTTTDREYINTLERAGAVCAADYNYCKAYVDSQMQKIGVE
jgi:hypothetical protein